MTEKEDVSATPVEPIVICAEPWYVVPREARSEIHIWCSIMRCAPSASPAAAWARFLEAYGETKQHWKREGHIAKKLTCQWTYSTETLVKHTH